MLDSIQDNCDNYKLIQEKINLLAHDNDLTNETDYRWVLTITNITTEDAVI